MMVGGTIDLVYEAEMEESKKQLRGEIAQLEVRLTDAVLAYGEVREKQHALRSTTSGSVSRLYKEPLQERGNWEVVMGVVNKRCVAAEAVVHALENRLAECRDMLHRGEQA
jgi:hypothetical protein